MRTLSIDIETYSEENLLKQGVYKYVDSPSFEILLFAYKIDNDVTKCVELAKGDNLPDEVMDLLHDPSCLKIAFNAQFERVCINKYLETELMMDPIPTEQWECTLVKGALLGLPLSLAKMSDALGTEQQKQKSGKLLINYFSVPCKPTKANGGRTRNLWHHNEQKWNSFVKYCIADVDTECAIRDKIDFFDIDFREKESYRIDQEINDTGIAVDMDLVNGAVDIADMYMERKLTELKKRTGLPNPNSGVQFKTWVGRKMGKTIDSLAKDNIHLVYDDEACTDEVRAALDIKQDLGKTSLKKFNTIQGCVCGDNRVRGLLQFYGANRTGRWAGRLVQIHNLKKNKVIKTENLAFARDVVKEHDVDMVDMLYGDVCNSVSELIRTAFIPFPGYKFVVADFASIEARVLAWLAGEDWKLDVFNSHGKIYEASAAMMFGVHIDEVDMGMRAKGKVAELALGYQGSIGALKVMGADKMGLSEPEMRHIVDKWRNANPKIKDLWAECEEAFIDAMEYRTGIYGDGYIMKIEKHQGIEYLFVELPSGRKLSYVNPQYNRGASYMGMCQETNRWKRIDTYGGKLVENIVQGIARDCLDYTIKVLKSGTWGRIVTHVHDEVILEIEASDAEDALKWVEDCMKLVPEWAKGLPLRGEGFIADYYQK